MENYKYRYNWEYAVKYTIPVTDETKDSNVELYDRFWKWFVDVANIKTDELVSLISEIWWTWRDISEEEYERIINNEK